MAVLQNIRNGYFRLEAVQNVLRAYFVPRTIRPAQVPGIRFRHIYTGAMGNIWANLIAGIFFIYFGNRIGMTPFEWGVMGSITSLMLLSELLSAALTQRVGHRKGLWFVFAMLDRGLRFGGIVLALILWRWYGWAHASVALIAAVSLATLMGAMAGPPWLSWLADLIPEEEHGAFWGRRSVWVNLSVVLTVVPAGIVMDRLPEQYKMRYTMAVFAVATVLGVLDVVIHGTIPEPRMSRPRERRMLPQLLEPLRDRAFRPLLAFNFCWTFSMMIGGALLLVYMMEDLDCKRRFLGTALATTSTYITGAALTAGWTGKLVDRLGAKRVMFWTYLFWAAIPFCWFFFTPASVLYITAAVNFVAGGVITAGMNAMLKIQTRFPPPEHRPMYIAVSNSVNYVAAAVAAFLAGVIVQALSDWEWDIGAVTLHRYDVLAAISLTLRMASVLFLLNRIRERRDNGESEAAKLGTSEHVSKP